jgi:hypothetical protein
MKTTKTRGEIGMAIANVAERVKNCVLAQLDAANSQVDRGKVVPTAGLVDDLLFDNLDMEEYRALLETEFGIDSNIPADGVQNGWTLNDWSTYITANGQK